MDKKHYSILLGRKVGGCNGYRDIQFFNVYCTDEELRIVAKALCGYEDHCTDDIFWCMAKEGGDVSSDNFDFLFADCM